MDSKAAKMLKKLLNTGRNHQMVLHIIIWSRTRRYLFLTCHDFYGLVARRCFYSVKWQLTLQKNFKCELSNVPNRTPSALTNNHIHEQCRILKDILF